MDDTAPPDGSPSRDEDEELYEQWRRLRQEFGEERWKLYTSGLLEYTLGELIHLWPRELDRLGLTGGKDRSPSDVPQEPGMVLVEATDGRKVWIKPGAYRDEEGHLRAEVREHYARTDGAIWAMLAVLEGGEGSTREGDLERTLREDYEAWRPLRVADEPLNPANDKLLTCAEAAAYEHRPDLDTLRAQERGEVIVGFALRIHAVAKATREFQEYGERRRLGHMGDPARDVLAWELQQQGVSSVEIGRRLGIPQTDQDRIKKDNQKVRKAAERGGKLMSKAREALNQTPS